MWHTIAQAGIANAGLTFEAWWLGLEFFGLFALTAALIVWSALRPQRPAAPAPRPVAADVPAAYQMAA